jgi:hypothetical protein
VAKREPISWVTQEPETVAREKAAMADLAPGMKWGDDLEWPTGRPSRGWRGRAPLWAADRPKPIGVEELVGDRRLELEILYPEAFPAAPPSLFPIKPQVPIERRTQNRWHVNGDGSLCLMQAADDWQLTNTAADLLSKASGWFVEYLLLDAGAIDEMSQYGMNVDTSLDELLAKYVSS